MASKAPFKIPPVRLAFIGAGIVAGPHSKGVQRNASIEFAGAYDPDTAAAQRVVNTLGGKVYRDLDEVNTDRNVDAVIVMNPNRLHYETAVAALEAGKHVMIEKPVAENCTQIDRLQALAQKQQRVCMPAHNYIYVPALMRAKRFIDEGRFGQVTSFWVLYNIYHSEAVARRYGGVLREVCIHHAYSLVYFLGRPKRVRAIASSVHYEQLSCEDQVMITCEMPDGAIANLWASFAADDPTSDPWTVMYKILGSKGGVGYTWNDAHFDDQGGPAYGIPNYIDSFANEQAHFVEQCIARGVAPLSTLEDTKDAMQIIEAAEASIARECEGCNIYCNESYPDRRNDVQVENIPDSGN